MQKSSLIALAILASALVSCNQPTNSHSDPVEGSLTVSVSDSASRAMLPELDMNLASYSIEGSGPSGATFAVAGPGPSFTVEKLAFGEWTLIVRGLNAEGVAVAVGNATAVVRTGEATLVSVAVRPYEGDGTFCLNLGWNAADLDIPGASASLLPVVGQSISLPIALSAGSAASGSFALAAGYYTLTSTLTDNGIVVAGAAELVRVAAGAVTKGTIFFDKINKPGGSISVDIDVDMSDPLTVSISGVPSLLVGAGSATAVASVAGNVNATVAWFLNGESVAIGSEYAIAGLNDGFYRLDAVAFSADGKRAGSASVSFEASGSIDLSGYLPIHTVQGASHSSPYAGQAVRNVVGVVTARDSRQFWMQSPVADGDDRTSEGILVYTNAVPGVNVGDLVLVSGTVSEFNYSSSPNNLRITEIANPTVEATLATNYPLPDAIVIGRGGRVPPNAIICDDGNIGAGGEFDPENDGIDFWESLEFMLVRVNDAVVTGGGKYGEIPVLADDGADAAPGSRTARGGVAISEGRFNPNLLIVDSDSYILCLEPIEAKAGDRFAAPVLGVLGYDYGTWRVLPTVAPILVPGSLSREAADFASESDRLTVATFNIENFPRPVASMTEADVEANITEVARAIVDGLRSPDILALQEITDDSYSQNDGVVSPTGNLNRLIAAIAAAGGPSTYRFAQIDPANNTNGGWTGANIRVAYLYNAARVAFPEKAGGNATRAVGAVLENGNLDLDVNPGLVDPDSFAGSRKPLAARFVFNGHDVFVVNNHLASKGGDHPLFGMTQPPVLASEAERLVQARAVNAFADSLLALDPEALVVVAGDMNDFGFSAPLQTVLGDDLVDLVAETLPQAERYSYVYNGNSQQLDHLLASPALRAADPLVDIVHRNAEFDPSIRVSDHDPVVASFLLPGQAVDLPPVWNSGCPAVDVLGETAARVSFSLNEAGTVSYAVRDASGAEPTVAELIAGASVSVADSDVATVELSGLASATDYVLYAVASDNAGNVQFSPSAVAFTTEGGAIDPPGSDYSGLFFSDYGEGASNNKYLELYNAGSGSLALDGVFMILLSNDYVLQTGAQIRAFPAGSAIAPGAVYGIHNAQAAAAIRDNVSAANSFDSTATYFNGDDDIVLVRDANANGSYEHGTDQILDLIGYAYERVNFGTDRGFRRNAEVSSGSETFVPGQWTEYARSDVDAGTYYGVHP